MIFHVYVLVSGEAVNLIQDSHTHTTNTYLRILEEHRISQDTNTATTATTTTDPGRQHRVKEEGLDLSENYESLLTLERAFRPNNIRLCELIQYFLQVFQDSEIEKMEDN